MVTSCNPNKRTPVGTKLLGLAWLVGMMKIDDWFVLSPKSLIMSLVSIPCIVIVFGRTLTNQIRTLAIEMF